MDVYLSLEGNLGIEIGSRANALPQILDDMVNGDLVTRDQANKFLKVHALILEEGLMQ